MLNKIKFFILGAITTVILTTGASAFASGNVAQQLKVYFNNIKVVVDGSPVNLGKDSTGKAIEPFIYNGTTYLPISAVGKALGKDVSWDGKTSTVFVGEKPGQVNYLMKYGYGGSYYTKFDSSKSDSFSMGGKTYKHGYVLGWSSKNFFNLNGQFKELTFEIGNVLQASGEGNYIDIYLDGKLYDTVVIERGQLPEEYKLPVKGVHQVKFELDNHGFSSNKLGIGNPILK